MEGRAGQAGGVGHGVVGSTQWRWPPWTPILAFWVVLGLVAALQETWLFHSAGQPLRLWVALAWETPKYVLWGIFTPLVVRLDRRTRGVSAPNLRALAPHLLLAAFLILLHASYATAADFVVLPPPQGIAAFPALLLRQLRARLQFDALSYAGIVGGWYALDYFRRHAREEAVAAHLEGELARAELLTLKMRLQPHFLFNALQALAVLNRRDPGAVTENLLRLGSLYRYLTRTSGLQEVELGHELDFVARYLALEELRFPDRLRVVLDVPSTLRCAVVPHLVLQPLVENAVQHGVAPLERPGTVRITARREGEVLLLEVTDDGVGLSPHSADAAHDAGPSPAHGGTDGIGLAVTGARLRHLYGDRSGIEVGPRDGGGVVARVRVPYREGSPTHVTFDSADEVPRSVAPPRPNEAQRGNG